MKGSITKRSSGSYQLKFDIGRDFEGKRQVRYKTVTGTKRDAEAELSRIITEINTGSFIEKARIRVADWMPRYLNQISQPRTSPKTHERYEEISRFHIVPHIGHIALQKLNGTHIQELYSTLRKEGKRPRQKLQDPNVKWKGLSEQTLLHIHRFLFKALKEATRKRLIFRNPAEDVDSPRPRAALNAVLAHEDSGREHTNALDQDELKILLTGLEPYNELWTLVAVDVNTGLRRGEAAGLTWADIDLEKQTLRVSRSIEETRQGIRIKSPKNKSSKRTLGIDAGLVQILRDHWKSQAELALKLGIRISKESFVFPESPLNFSMPIRPSRVTHRFSHHAKRLGFPKLRFHDLRHTHATLLLEANTPVHSVAQRLGHSTPTETLGRYGWVLKKSEDQAVRVAGAILANVLKKSD